MDRILLTEFASRDVATGVLEPRNIFARLTLVEVAASHPERNAEAAQIECCLWAI